MDITFNMGIYLPATEYLDKYLIISNINNENRIDTDNKSRNKQIQ